MPARAFIVIQRAYVNERSHTGQRDIAGFLQYFSDVAEMVCGVEVKSEPKAEKADEISRAAWGIGMRSIPCNSLRDAILACLADSEERLGGAPIRILVCGSLYLAGDLLAANREP